MYYTSKANGQLKRLRSISIKNRFIQYTSPCYCMPGDEQQTAVIQCLFDAESSPFSHYYVLQYGI